MTPPLDYRDYKRRDVGVDASAGRFGTVSIERCRHCGTAWLTYQLEQEWNPQSGRWYRGAISDARADTVTAEAALDLLASLPWHLRGGSFYRSAGERRDAPLDTRHL